MSACSSARTMLSSFSVHGDSSPRTASRPARAGLAAGALAGVALAGLPSGCLRRVFVGRCLRGLGRRRLRRLRSRCLRSRRLRSRCLRSRCLRSRCLRSRCLRSRCLGGGGPGGGLLDRRRCRCLRRGGRLARRRLGSGLRGGLGGAWVDFAALGSGLHGRLRRIWWLTSPWTWWLACRSAVDFAALVALAGLCAAGLPVDFAVLLAFAGGLVVATPRAGLALFAAGLRGAVLTGRASLAGADFLAGAACPVLLAISVAPFEVLIGRRGGRCGKDRRGPGGAQSPAPSRQRPGCARGGRRDAPGSRLVRVRTACQLPNGKRGGSAELEPEPLSPESDCWWAALDRVGSGEPPDAAGAGPSGPSPATGSASRSRNCPSR